MPSFIKMWVRFWVVRWRFVIMERHRDELHAEPNDIANCTAQVNVLAGSPLPTCRSFTMGKRSNVFLRKLDWTSMDAQLI